MDTNMPLCICYVIHKIFSLLFLHEASIQFPHTIFRTPTPNFYGTSGARAPEPVRIWACSLSCICRVDMIVHYFESVLLNDFEKASKSPNVYRTC